MIRLDTLSSSPGARKDRKRVGRGDGSGKGTYSGRGSKGQKSRSGYRIKPGFEGGQLPIIKRLPTQRGFTNIFKTDYAVVNVSALVAFDAGTEVTPDKLVEAGIIDSRRKPVKILGSGELDRSLTVKANKFSAGARTKIETAGGKVEEIGNNAPEGD